MKRVFLMVLDSLGIGASPDAHLFGDAGTNTLHSCAKSGNLQIPNLLDMGLGNIQGIDFLEKSKTPMASYGRLREKSNGKDTTIGHWELAGIISKKPLPTYPEGFPEAIIKPFSEAVGRGVLCNRPYSGTDVIRDYGRQHMKTGDLIVYTSADSVFQIAAHEGIVPPQELYEYCKIARKLLTGKHSLGRVIARPFEGEWPFKRTANRHDFSLVPPQKTLLDAICEAGKSVIAVGKISDIFAGQGITEAIPTKSNTHGMEVALSCAKRDFEGLCFVNLVDFDAVYGHRQDAAGYAKAISEFDAWLPSFIEELCEEDALIITADHGCDPSDDSTDHTREDVPLLICGKKISSADLGVSDTFANVAATVADLLNVDYDCEGKSLLEG